MVLAVLFWVFWVLGLLGVGFWRWPGSPTPAFGVDILGWLLIGLLGLRVFAVAL